MYSIPILSREFTYRTSSSFLYLSFLLWPWRLPESLLKQFTERKEGFGSLGLGEENPHIPDSESIAHAVSYTKYNWFAWILPLFLSCNLPSGGGATQQEKDQKLNIRREKRQNDTLAASVPE